MLLLIVAASGASPEPAPFPVAASYTAHLRTTNQSKLCPSCTFDGRHHYDSDEKKLFGHVTRLSNIARPGSTLPAAHPPLHVELEIM